MRWKGEKAKAWEAVRNYVKAKEKDCYTCEAKRLTGQNAQAGHYLPIGHVGSNNTLSWDERGIHLQCSRCNGVGQGEQVSFREHLVRDYGEAVVQSLEARRWKIDPIKDWVKVREHYESLLKQLPVDNGVV